jgi:hypothetical protein
VGHVDVLGRGDVMQEGPWLAASVPPGVVNRVTHLLQSHVAGRDLIHCNIDRYLPMQPLVQWMFLDDFH